MICIEEGNRNKPDEASAEINLIYQLLADAIKSAKNQIWLTMYYVLLVDATIIGFYSLLKVKALEWLLLIIATVILIAGISLVAHFNNWLMKNRQQIDLKIKPKLSDAAQDALDKDVTTRWKAFDIIFFIGSIILFLLGYVFVVWFLFYNKI